MSKRVLNIVASIIVAMLFIWLAVKNVDLNELWSEISGVSLYWLAPFLVTLLISHYLRAERWRLLLLNDQKKVHRSTLFAGVMMGYMVNNLLPRVGEITRPVYVAKKAGLSSSNLIGTIVIERLFDVATMLILIFLSAAYLISDLTTVERLLGVDGWPWYVYLSIPAFFVFIAISIYAAYRVLLMLEGQKKIKSRLLLKIVEKARSFSEGILSIRYIKNWPLFLLFTAGIWVGYIIMTYLPFYMMNLQAVYGLTISDAVVLTMVSSIGVSIPTPAGIGSYHLLIQQSMSLLYSVPLVTALTYATVAHAITILTVFLTTPIALWWDKYYTLKHPV